MYCQLIETGGSDVQPGQRMTRTEEKMNIMRKQKSRMWDICTITSIDSSKGQCHRRKKEGEELVYVKINTNHLKK